MGNVWLGEQIGVTPLGVPIYASGRDPSLDMPPPLTKAPADADWLAWARQTVKLMRLGVL